MAIAQAQTAAQTTAQTSAQSRFIFSVFRFSYENKFKSYILSVGWVIEFEFDFKEKSIKRERML